MPNYVDPADAATCPFRSSNAAGMLAEGENKNSWRWFNTVNRVCSGVKKVRCLFLVFSHLSLTRGCATVDSRSPAGPHPAHVVPPQSKFYCREPGAGDGDAADAGSDGSSLDGREDARLNRRSSEDEQSTLFVYIPKKRERGYRGRRRCHYEDASSSPVPLPLLPLLLPIQLAQYRRKRTRSLERQLRSPARAPAHPRPSRRRWASRVLPLFRPLERRS